MSDSEWFPWLEHTVRQRFHTPAGAICPTWSLSRWKNWQVCGRFTSFLTSYLHPEWEKSETIFITYQRGMMTVSTYESLPLCQFWWNIWNFNNFQSRQDKNLNCGYLGWHSVSVLGLLLSLGCCLWVWIFFFLRLCEFCIFSVGLRWVIWFPPTVQKHVDWLHEISYECVCMCGGVLWPVIHWDHIQGFQGYHLESSVPGIHCDPGQDKALTENDWT